MDDAMRAAAQIDAMEERKFKRLTAEIGMIIGSLSLGACLACTLLVLKGDGGTWTILGAAVALSVGSFLMVMGGLSWYSLNR